MDIGSGEKLADVFGAFSAERAAAASLMAKGEGALFLGFRHGANQLVDALAAEAESVGDFASRSAPDIEAPYGLFKLSAGANHGLFTSAKFFAGGFTGPQQAVLQAHLENSVYRPSTNEGPGQFCQGRRCRTSHRGVFQSRA
jgi:hypothetical protein